MAERLIKAGKSPDTPAAVIEQATLPRQRVTVATLNTIADAAQQAGVRPPAITIVGRVVELRSRLAWLEKLPLHGQCVLVTRSRPQASRLSQRLRELGAEVIEAPTIAIEAPKDCRPLDSALRRLKEFHLLALTSPNGVAAVFDRLRLLGLDARALANLRVAAVGSETAAELLARGIAADIVPEEYTTAAMAQAIRQSAVPAGARVLLARADIATPELADALAKGGFFVEEAVAYRTVRPESLSGEAKDALAAGRVNWITFTSSSTVENFLALVDTPEVLRAIKLASIGPVTSQTLRKHGHAPTVEAQTHTIDALADAMATYQRKKHSG
jgi:uroporphyrinogen III methyltransferase/synthase